MSPQLPSINSWGLSKRLPDAKSILGLEARGSRNGAAGNEPGGGGSEQRFPTICLNGVALEQSLDP